MFSELTLRLPESGSLAAFIRHSIRTSCRPIKISPERRAWFCFAWLFIGLVSLYDGYLVLVYQCCIVDVELNPLALHLIRCNGSDVTVLLQAKAVGTCCVLGVLSLLYRLAPRFAFPVTNALATFQFGLLMFLNLA